MTPRITRRAVTAWHGTPLATTRCRWSASRVVRISGWVQLTHKCVTVSPNSSGAFNTTIKCPTRGAFKTWVEGTKRNGRVDVKMSGGIYLECRH